MKVVVSNYGAGDNSVLVVNRAIRDGLVFSGLLARDGDLTYRGKPPGRHSYRGAPLLKAYVEKHGPPNVIVGQASFALDLFREAKRIAPGALLVLQRDSTHMRTWKELVDAEYEREGLQHRLGMDLVRHEEAEYELADAITVLSRWVERSFYARGLGHKTYYASPQTIMLNRWNPMPRPADGIKFRVMVAGQMRVAKGTHLILRAWRKLKPEGDEELILSGCYSENMPRDERLLIESEYEETRRSARVINGGWCPIERMHERFAACDVYCLPSIQEGSSMTCTEALACGRPIVVSDRCGSDILEENPGECGEMFDVHDEAAIIEYLNRYRRDRALIKAHGKRGRELVEQYGGMERFGRDYAETIKKIWHDLR